MVLVETLNELHRQDVLINLLGFRMKIEHHVALAVVSFTKATNLIIISHQAPIDTYKL